MIKSLKLMLVSLQIRPDSFVYIQISYDYFSFKTRVSGTRHDGVWVDVAVSSFQKNTDGSILE